MKSGQLAQQLVLNIETGANGSVTFSDNFGDTPVMESLKKNGNNFFTISGADFSSISWASTVNATDVKQVRFDGITTPGGGGGGSGAPPPVPEPATLALFGAALAGLGGLRLRRRKT